MSPLAIDLFCGLGGWTDGLLAEGYYVVGFDIERHDYGTGSYPAQLVLQDVMTIHGRQFKDAALIVASPPCQEYSYMAMPWSIAKQKRREYLDGTRDRKDLTALFDACFRIQREASEAAGHHIPLVVENVRGACEWVGRSRWNYGSFHLWGDVPALMPLTKGGIKAPGMNWSDQTMRGQDFTRIAAKHLRCDCQNPEPKSGVALISMECPVHNWNPNPKPEGIKGVPHRTKGHWTNPAEHEGIKQHKSGRAWFADPDSISGSTTSGSKARKAASAAIAKIPFPLSQHIAKYWKPQSEAA